MKVLYRISQGGNNKYKPDFVYDKKLMFIHFINIFKDEDVYIFADNINNELYDFIKSNCKNFKLYKTSLGNSSSFMFTLDYAINNFNDEDTVYFAEDDYIYKKIAPKIISEGLMISDYSSGYDHPDKYLNYNEGGPNPFIEKGGELTRVMITENIHWKLTNSCCMTFASIVKTLKQDYEIFKNHCSGNIPNDFGIFCDLYKKNRTVASCIPAVSTHGEVQWLSKFVDWHKEFVDSLTI
jgi:hypothetical protein